MESDRSDAEKIRIFDKCNAGFLDFVYGGPSQCLFVWKGDLSKAISLYSCIQSVMKEFEIGNIHFGKLSHCDAAWGNCAYIMMDDVLSPQQKYKIIKGIESKGYATAVEPLF
ncbi:MAG: hypothetical protein ABIF85_00650 [Nanoarchaeota archaeon]|nr:hypothetical protein [Nanoarchaeota archaeon]MBU4300692.1 hypothetical protein [Nanoarchaeota archaeon]MBU4451795.1 hypothetical protein [Nanoarchaeota archaeon]MCG2723476.1 hypothetical protein [archaeon]